VLGPTTRNARAGGQSTIYPKLTGRQRARATYRTPCYGVLAMCMIGCAGPPTPSKYWMYHTLVAAPAFLVYSTIGPTATIYHKLYLSYEALPCGRCHMIERIRLGPRCPMNRDGALPVGRYAIQTISRWPASIIGSKTAYAVTAALVP
jgi:hypothetical protein